MLRRIRYMERFGTAWEKISQEVSSRQTRTYLKRLEEAQRVQGSEGPVQHPDRTYRLSPGVWIDAEVGSSK